MTDTAPQSDTQDIVVEEIFPHAPETIWKVLTTSDLIARWLVMPATEFEPVKGKRFTFQTTPGGQWDGVIRCEVLEVIPNERLVHSWKGGHDANVGYGARLDTVVTWTLTRTDGGTRVCMVHSGFVMPRNDSAFKNMSGGWAKVVQRVGVLSAECGSATKGEKR